MQTMGRFDLGGGLTILLPYPCLILYPCSPSLLSKHLPLPPTSFIFCTSPYLCPSFLSKMPARGSSRRCQSDSPSPIETFDTGLTQFAPLLIPTIILC